MSDIELATVGLMENVEQLVRAIDTATTEEATGAFSRMKVAREWAKLQPNAAALAERLVWIEAVILRRIGRLDATVLPGPQRAAARHFATLDNADLSALLNDFPARSAISAYNLWARAEGIKKATRRGRMAAIGESQAYADDDPTTPETLKYAISERVVTVRQAAAVLVGEYASHYGIPATASQIVDEFLADEQPISPTASALEVTAFRRGLADAVREAFTNAPVETTERSWELPAFITTYNESTEEWQRIPSEFARVAQARQMLELRRGQVESLRRSVDALAEVLEGRLKVHERDGDEWLREDPTATSRRLASTARADVA